MKRVLLFTTTAILFALAGFLMPAMKVKATSINDTPYSGSVFHFIKPEEVAVLDPQCKDANTGIYPTFYGGITDGIANPLEKALGSGSFEDFACAYISGNLASLVKDDSSSTGLLDITSTLSSSLLEQRPLSTQNYIQDQVYALTGKVNAAEPAAYFPGTGAQLLEPIQSFWGWSVNVVMLFLILIVIVIAFAIVFRQRIGGKEIVQIQNAIPSIAMAMILVPLSYAISGLFIDAITLGTNAIHSFFFNPGAPARSIYENSINENTCDADANSTGTTDDPCNRGLYADDYRVDVWNIRNQINISDEVEGVANTEIAGQGINKFIIMRVIAEVLNFLPLADGSPAYWLGQIINLIVGFLMIWIGIKIAWRLLKAYVTLVLYPIVSPFIFALVAVPGNSTKTIVDYAKTMFGASLMYIVTYAMFIVSYIFTSGVLNAQIPNFQRGIFTPPLIGLKSIFESLPAGSSRSLTDLMFAFIGIVVYFAIPKTLDDINAQFGGKFTLPALLTNAADSFRESINVTSRTAQLGVRAPLNLSRYGRATPARIEKTFGNLLDARRGLKPGEEGTWEARKKKELGERQSQVLKDLAQAKSAAAKARDNKDTATAMREEAKVRALNSQLSNIQNEAQRYGVSVGYGKEDQPPGLKATFSWKANPIVSFSPQDINAIRTQSNITTGGPYIPIKMPGGKIDFEVTGNANLPSNIIAEIYRVGKSEDFQGEEKAELLLSNINKSPEWKPSVTVTNSDLPVPRIIKGKSYYVDSYRPVPFTNPTDIHKAIEFRVDENQIMKPKTGEKSWEIGLDLIIRDPMLFVGTQANPGVLFKNPEILSDKVIFVLNSTLESNPVRITMKYSPT